MKVLFAAAELSPIARVGGLAEATSGLVAALARTGVTVEVVLPDYEDLPLAGEKAFNLSVPDWAGPARVRTGTHESAGRVTLVRVPAIARSHPYVDETGDPWPDNDARFMRFTAAVAALAERLQPDVLHLNDWHTAAATAFTQPATPTVLTIHTLGYQGVMDASWMERLPNARTRFAWYGGTNPLAGGIQLADVVTTVSPNYAREILHPDQGMGMDQLLAARGDSLVGIRNGIDLAEWNPATDPMIAENYDASDLSGKDACRRALLAEVGWPAAGEPVIGVVSRLVHQKGVDLLLDAARFLDDLPARLVVLGSGEPTLAAALRDAAEASPETIWFHEGYDVGMAHRIFAGTDLLAMPSRFEPCGLAQMQAMEYGTIPVVTPVGGLVDTVVDADRRRDGTGFLSRGVDGPALVDAMHRAVRAVRHRRRRSAIQRRGMSTDWSWDGPAAEYVDVYEEVITS